MKVLSSFKALPRTELSTLHRSMSATYVEVLEPGKDQRIVEKVLDRSAITKVVKSIGSVQCTMLVVAENGAEECACGGRHPHL